MKCRLPAHVLDRQATLSRLRPIILYLYPECTFCSEGGLAARFAIQRGYAIIVHRRSLGRQGFLRGCPIQTEEKGWRSTIRSLIVPISPKENPQ